MGGCGSSATIFDRDEIPVAICASCNPLRGDSLDVEGSPGIPRAVWSGWASEEEIGPTGVWGPGPWGEFEAWCEVTGRAALEAGREIWFRPHAGHVLCDPQRCLSFLRARPEGPFRLLLDPAAMLTEGMETVGEDHLARSVEALGAHPLTVGVVLERGGRFESALSGLIEAHVPRERPVVLLGSDPGAD